MLGVSNFKINDFVCRLSEKDMSLLALDHKYLKNDVDAYLDGVKEFNEEKCRESERYGKHLNANMVVMIWIIHS